MVKTSFGQAYANNTTQLSGMIEQLINSEPETPYIDKQFTTMLEEIELREDAFKVSVIIGNCYLSNYSGAFIDKVAEAGIHCCIVEPFTQYGSWYYNLSEKTDGLLVYNYIFFSDEVLNYIYGYVPDVPISKYTMILGKSIKTIILKQELKANGTTDTDADTLTDWEEVNQAKVKVYFDGTVQLPTYKAYIDKYEGGWVSYSRWQDRFVNVRDIMGKNLSNILSEIYVLPVLSDPTKADGDNDGILDTDEIGWDGVDERYKKVGALHKDTVETLFPEIKKRKRQITSPPSYITIDGNDVVLHLSVVMKGDKDKLAVDVLETDVFDPEKQEEINRILERLGKNVTLKDLAIDAIVNRWSGSYNGSKYDFYEKLKVNFRVELKEITPSPYVRGRIEVTFKTGVCGKSNLSWVDWKSNCNRYVTIYDSWCNVPEHEDMYVADCSKYGNNEYNVLNYEGAAGHEFGHVLGLLDMYHSADCNHGFEPVSNDEIVYDVTDKGLPEGYGIMKFNGAACANDIEMVLFAFSENTWQYFVPYAWYQKISKAIKSDVKYIFKENSSPEYVWNSSLHYFELLR